MTGALPSDPYPGSALAEAELQSAADTGTKAIIDAVGAMAILGELGRLRDRLDVATRLLRASANGSACWALTAHGMEACEVPGAAEFLAGTGRRRRWWRH